MRSNLIRVCDGLPVGPLVATIEARPDLWEEITDRQDHPESAHRETKAIFLRWCAGRDVESVFNDLETVNCADGIRLINQAYPLIESLDNATGAESIARVMVVNLPVGGIVDLHVDRGRYADTFERFHIALKTNRDAVYWCERTDGVTESVNMKVGEAWWFNHKAPHWASNIGETDRWHMIVDMKSPTFRREREV